jgi:hypothetical protein
MNMKNFKVMGILRQPFPIEIIVDENTWRMWNISDIWV